MKRLAILTSGGDCSGMNATIRAAVRTAIANNIEMIGYRKGFAGLLKNDYIVLNTQAVSGTMQRGGDISAVGPLDRVPHRRGA